MAVVDGCLQSSIVCYEVGLPLPDTEWQAVGVDLVKVTSALRIYVIYFSML